MSYPSRKSYPHATMMNLDPTAQRKKARSISAKGLTKHATPGSRLLVCLSWLLSSRVWMLELLIEQ
jgi:hypothetical protein